MDAFLAWLVFLEVAVAICVVIICLWIIMPRGLDCFKRWKKDDNPRSFSSGVFCFFVSFLMLLLVGIWITRKIEALEMYFMSWPTRLIVFLAITYSLIYLFIPKALIFYQRWKARRKNTNFSISVLFALISLFLMNYMLRLFLPIFTR